VEDDAGYRRLSTPALVHIISLGLIESIPYRNIVPAKSHQEQPRFRILELAARILSSARLHLLLA
jgi:hypothetical protein